MSKVLVTFTGPSGSGKSTVCRNLAARYNIKELVSHTTRGRRAGEVDGKNYHFMSKEAFDTVLSDHGFIEHVEFSGNRYALSKAEVDNMEGIHTLVVEPEGLKQIQDYCDENDISLLRVFVDGETEDLLIRVLRRFAEDGVSNASIYAKRIQNLVLQESQWHNECDVDMKFDNYDRENKMSLPDEVYEVANSMLILQPPIEPDDVSYPLDASGKGSENLYIEEEEPIEEPIDEEPVEELVEELVLLELKELLVELDSSLKELSELKELLVEEILELVDSELKDLLELLVELDVEEVELLVEL